MCQHTGSLRPLSKVDETFSKCNPDVVIEVVIFFTEHYSFFLSRPPASGTFLLGTLAAWNEGIE